MSPDALDPYAGAEDPQAGPHHGGPGARAVLLFVVLVGTLSALAWLVASTASQRPPLVVTAAPALPVPAAGEALAGSGARASTPDAFLTSGLADPAWLRRTAQATGIPETALRAYADAQLTGGGGCGVGWTTLAGLGWVESQHGTYEGRTLLADGRSDRVIIGVPLDGRGDVAAIRSTPESQAWHGDPQWEHAVGPLQFLRSSWEPYATDGDQDGLADPHDLDDAAATAAAYLCGSGQDLATGPGWTRAVLSYNRSADYVRAVHDAAQAYAERAASVG